jgi:hypothetical protein
MGRKKKIVGPRSQIPDLIYDPVNEQGVIFLFAKYHRELGIDYIEGIRQGFPDAFGKRKAGREAYEDVNIEFEFESLDFKRHKHDPNECDIIVCWKHNWRECPIEVIELKSALPQISAGEVLSTRPPAPKPRLIGKVTPEREYRIPILVALMEMGGRGRVKDILKRVEATMKDKLTKTDYEKLPSGTYVRWVNYAMWERLNMINDGLLEKGSPRGVWEITEKGKLYLSERAGAATSKGISRLKQSS